MPARKSNRRQQKKSKRSTTNRSKPKKLVPDKDLYPRPMPVYSGWPFQPKMGKWAHEEPMPTWPVEMITLNNSSGGVLRTVFVPNKYIYVGAITDIGNSINFAFKNGKSILKSGSKEYTTGEEIKADKNIMHVLNTPTKEEYSHEVLFLRWDEFERFFPGSNANARFEHEWDYFGSQLVHLKEEKYLLIANGMFEFNVPQGDVIIDFYAHWGPNHVMYDFGIGQKFLYIFELGFTKIIGYYVDIAFFTSEFIEHIRSIFRKRTEDDVKDEVDEMLTNAILPRSAEEFKARSFIEDQAFCPFYYLEYEAAWGPSLEFKRLAKYLNKKYVTALKATRIIVPFAIEHDYPYNPYHRVFLEDANDSVFPLNKRHIGRMAELRKWVFRTFDIVKE